MSAPLIELVGLRKAYGEGATRFEALCGIDLAIERGEFVAIVGSSGSGKSTLMNLLGCLDQPSGGHYRFQGREVGDLDPESLARLRRDCFGFVFQQYNLVGNADALGNVEVPALYAGLGRSQRRERARGLLERLGLGERVTHRPSALSGGQQQRVSIARALMNGADVILADEPTGALDSASGQEVLRLLRELHAEGRTVILITHDPAVAAAADRRIEIVDGSIVSDTGTIDDPAGAGAVAPLQSSAKRSGGLPLSEAAGIAWRSLAANRFRTLLTLLGIVIGVGAVIVMLAIGDGARDEVVTRIQGMGSDLLVVRPGAPGQRGGDATLTAADAEAVAGLPNVRAAAPEISGSMTLRAGLQDIRTSLLATSADYAALQNWPVAAGMFLQDSDLDSYAPVVVLGQTVAEALFPAGSDPIGQWVLAQNVPLQVIGVLTPKGATSWGSDQDDVAIAPLTTGQLRLLGQQHLRSITAQVERGADVHDVEAAIDRLLLERHGLRDFSIRNRAALIASVEETQQTLTLLLGSIAAVSLLVGGIGVMNIMLVSVTERTREIGVRMAVGARPRDVMAQFLVEALVVCGLGAGIGVLLGLAVTWGVGALGTPVLITLPPIVGAAACAMLIGLVFGLMPARRAAQLDPVRALGAD
ncbi:MacB family efflux pump subunit [Aquibaculum sediminis]|uniref:MacB family efflux pump subunit n=1 Tax=Aquibaculum sediminis TaxID=3231907 RepID=UPI003454098E